MASFGTAVGVAFAEEARIQKETEDEEIELNDLSKPARHLSDVENQLHDENELLELEPLSIVTPAASYAAGTALKHIKTTVTASPLTSIADVSSAASVTRSPSAFATAHRSLRASVSPPASTSSSRGRSILLRFKFFAKRWLWRERKRLEGTAKHQIWWLISGTERALKRSESVRNMKGDTGQCIASVEQFIPISGNRGINSLPWYIIDPQGTVSIIWTLFMTVLLLYCAITIPYFIAFNQSDSFRYADIVVDCMFFCDIICCFVTAHVKFDDELDYQLEINPRVLAKRYIRGWLLLDILGTVPFTEIMRDSVQGAESFPRLFKLIRILRLIKLLRLSRFGQKAAVIKNVVKMHVVLFKCVKFLIFFMLLAHTMANILIFTAIFASDEHSKPQNWLTESRAIFKDDVGMMRISDSAESTQYLMALYWAFTTIVTVGYGDIYPVQTAEVGVCLLNMIIGACIVSFIVGNVASIFAAADSSGGMNTMVAELNFKYKLSPELQRKLKLWFDSLKKVTGSSAPHWPDELGRLSKGMRRELVHKVAGAALSASQLFPDNSQLYLALYNCIQRHVFFTRDTIYRSGDACTRVYFVVEGSVDIYLPSCRHPLLTLGKGAHFAELAVVSPEQLMRYDVLASQVTVCLSLNFADIDAAMKETNCPVAQMKTRALHFDNLLARCLRVSQKIFQLRFDTKSNDDERLQKYQEKLVQLSSALFLPESATAAAGMPSSPTTRMYNRRMSFSSADRPAFMAKTDKLMTLLRDRKEDEGKRISALELARKEVTALISRHEDIMLHS